MKILLSGGGSGGHVTPLKHVAQELKKSDKKTEILYVAPRGDKFSHILGKDKNVKQSFHIFSGKYRRYSGESFIQKLTDVKTILLNVRDLFFVLIGIVQSIFLLNKLRPDVILLKGGFVVVPLGIAAKLLSIPFVTHDSDTIAGLANKIVGRWAVINAVGQKHGEYPYSADKLSVVGVPISPNFKHSSSASQNDAKKRLGLAKNKNLTLIMGGSLGAESINRAVEKTLESLVKKTQVIIFAGNSDTSYISDKIKEEKLGKEVRVLDFVSDLSDYYAAADLVVTRAGTTTIAEVSAIAKPSIIIPASQLGDQNHNAKMLKSKKAAQIISDEELSSDPEILPKTVNKVLTDAKLAAQLGNNIHDFTDHEGTKKLARILTEVQQG